jgi:DNA-directed RNA polymerase subunit RPC12/RpoP
MNCPYCGSDAVQYDGIQDGGGDYGESVCDEYECLECGAMFEMDCWDDDGYGRAKHHRRNQAYEHLYEFIKGEENEQ